jgi:hypothetical protein
MGMTDIPHLGSLDGWLYFNDHPKKIKTPRVGKLVTEPLYKCEQ